MSIQKFKKKPYSIESSIALLKERGLIIKNEKSAKFFLSRINYFRLSGYFFHFQENNKFKNNVSFEDIEKYYVFDQKLRILLFEAIERIETFFCTVLNEEMCAIEKDSHWYINAEYFKNSKSRVVSSWYNFIQNKIKKREYSDILFIKKYRESETYPDVPPSWMIMEILSFGEILRLFSSLKKKYRIKIADHFNVKEKSLSNMLQIIRYIRNTVAHHSRIWNKRMPYDLNSNISYADKNNTYQSGVKTIIFLFSKIGFNSTWNTRMIKFFEEYNIENTQSIIALLKTLEK